MILKSIRRGFTLIELLVVIAIIGILSSVVLASLNSARVKGRDARRVADIGQLQLALELYYDANSGYPIQAIGTIPNALVTNSYISTIPTDPTNNAPYQYQYQSLNSDHTACSAPGPCAGYVLVAQLEGANNSSSYVAATVGSAVCSTAASAPYHYCVVR